MSLFKVDSGSVSGALGELGHGCSGYTEDWQRIDWRRLSFSGVLVWMREGINALTVVRAINSNKPEKSVHIGTFLMAGGAFWTVATTTFSGGCYWKCRVSKVTNRQNFKVRVELPSSSGAKLTNRLKAISRVCLSLFLPQLFEARLGGERKKRWRENSSP